MIYQELICFGEENINITSIDNGINGMKDEEGNGDYLLLTVSYDLEDDSDLPSPTDPKDDKKEEKKDDKKENNNLYIILGIVTGTVLVVIGFLVGLATKKNKAQ